jgi:PAS domain S-box-containing protein
VGGGPHQIVQYVRPIADACPMYEVTQVPQPGEEAGQLPVGQLAARLVDLARTQLGRDITWDSSVRRLHVDGRRLAEAEAWFVEILTATLEDLADAEGAAMERQRRIRDRVGRVIRDDTLTTVFQPILDLGTGSVVGAEALCRFPSEPRQPDVWFADAQSVGLGTSLELCAVVTALRRIDELPDGVYVGLNASPRLLCSDDLYRAVSVFPANRIVLELTEHAAVADYEELIVALDRLRGLGVRLAVDDLGAGFASFSHVLRIRPDILKMDISITRTIDVDPARRGLARGIVSLARELGAAVVAEGVETQAELDCLVGLGIDAAQGYLIARPTPLPLRAVAARPSTGPCCEDAGRSVDDRGLAETRFELALLHAPIGIALVGLDGAFLHVNPALVAMLGYDEEQLRTLTFHDVTHLDDVAVDVGLVDECLDGRRNGYRMDKRYRRSDGTVVACGLTVVLVRDPDGAPLYFISQIQPSTDVPVGSPRKVF